MIKKTLLKLLGWPLTLRFGDPLVMDRWRWLKTRLIRGEVRTFDAGCGNGCFSFAAAAAGNRVLAGSFDEGSISKARARAEIFGLKDISFVTIDLRDLELRAKELGQFDQIICTECIEHIVEDETFVRNLASLLKPGGTLLLTTPEISHKSLRYEERLLTEVGGHVRWGYDEKRLRELFTAAGLKVTEISYMSGWISQRLTDLMRVKQERLAWALTFPLRVFQYLDRGFNRIIRYPWMGIGVVGVKP